MAPVRSVPAGTSTRPPPSFAQVSMAFPLDAVFQSRAVRPRTQARYVEYARRKKRRAELARNVGGKFARLPAERERSQGRRPLSCCVNAFASSMQSNNSLKCPHRIAVPLAASTCSPRASARLTAATATPFALVPLLSRRKIHAGFVAVGLRSRAVAKISVGIFYRARIFLRRSFLFCSRPRYLHRREFLQLKNFRFRFCYTRV